MRRPADDGLPRILVVDDDVHLAAGLKQALSMDGYLVRTVERSVLAFEAAALFAPDLIVLDVMMPDLDGWEVLARLRASSSTASVPVIMLTAADTDDAKVKGLSLGADDYVTKPFGLQELKLRIAAVLRRVIGPADDSPSLPVVASGYGVEFVRCKDVHYIEGVRNYSYIYTAHSRFLGRLTLGAIEQQGIESFRRVHRSFIVNLQHVRGYGWASKSSFRLRLADANETEIPVSRALVPGVQQALGIRP